MATLKIVVSRICFSAALLATACLAADIDKVHATAGSGTVVSHVFNQISSRKWVKLDISNGAVVQTYREVNRDQWSVYLKSVSGNAKIYIDYWTKSIKNRAHPREKLYDIIPTTTYATLGNQHHLSRVNGFNVYHALLGTASGPEIMAVQKAGVKKWVILYVIGGRRIFIDAFDEVARDQWSVYFKHRNNGHTALNLWLKVYNLGWNQTPITSVLSFSG